MVDGWRVEPLTPRTWDAFADLAERHNGVWGGCGCTWFAGAGGGLVESYPYDLPPGWSARPA